MLAQNVVLDVEVGDLLPTVPAIPIEPSLFLDEGEESLERGSLFLGGLQMALVKKKEPVVLMCLLAEGERLVLGVEFRSVILQDYFLIDSIFLLLQSLVEKTQILFFGLPIFDGQLFVIPGQKDISEVRISVDKPPGGFLRVRECGSVREELLPVAFPVQDDELIKVPLGLLILFPLNV